MGDIGTVGFKGLGDRALELPSGVTPGFAVDVSPTSRARLRFNDISKTLQCSLDGGAYVDCFIAGGGSPWVEMGGVVRLQNVTDEVVIGDTAVVSSEKLRVVGESRLEDDVCVERIVKTLPGGSTDLVLEGDSGRVTVGETPTPMRFEAVVPDDTTTVFRMVDDGGRVYFDADTDNGAERLKFGGNVDLVAELELGTTTGVRAVAPDNIADSFRVADPAGNRYVGLDTSNGGEKLNFGGNVVLTPELELDAAVGIRAVVLDNIADTFKVEDPAGVSYLAIDTRNGIEAVEIGNATTNPDIRFVGTGDVSLPADSPLCLTESAGDPGAVANTGKVYTKDVSAVTELFYQDSGGSVVQLTSGGSIPGSTDVAMTDNTANAFLVHEGARNYIDCTTTNGAEQITLGDTTLEIKTWIDVIDASTEVLRIQDNTNNNPLLSLSSSGGAFTYTFGTNDPETPTYVFWTRGGNSGAWVVLDEDDNADLFRVTNSPTVGFVVGDGSRALRLTVTGGSNLGQGIEMKGASGTRTTTGSLSGMIYPHLISGTYELAYVDENDVETQITSNGSVVGGSSTTNLTFEINSDAVAGSDEDPVLILSGGDGGAEIIQTRMTQDSSTDVVYLTTALSTVSAGTSDRGTTLLLGPSGDFDAAGNVASSSTFFIGHRAGDPVGNRYLASLSLNMGGAQPIFSMSVQANPNAGGTGVIVNHLGGLGGAGSGATPGGTGGAARVFGATGGGGTASAVSGVGGVLQLGGGSAGLTGGFGGNAGGIVQVRGGSGTSGGAHGTVSIGDQTTSQVILGNPTDDPQIFIDSVGGLQFSNDGAQTIDGEQSADEVVGVAFTYTGGTGGLSAGGGDGGVGGGVTVVGGTGGDGDGGNLSGAGGDVLIAGGPSGASGGSGLGAPGNVTIRGGTGDFDGDIIIGDADTNDIAFFGTSGAGQQTITGSRGGNAALADLLTSLASLGLIIDSSSA